MASITKTALTALQADLKKTLADANGFFEKYNISQTKRRGKRSLTDTTSAMNNEEALVADQKVSLRLIHHFACSGGTLVSKCIAAQPNVFILSEVHPYSTLHIVSSKAKFLPTDITSQSRYARIPDADRLAETLFVENILATEKHVRMQGGQLVLRVHTHSDYCVGDDIAHIESVSKLLAPYFHLKHLVTLRDPIDSYKSLLDNNWIHFSPGTFDEYCRRLLVFLNQFSEDQVVRYEDFTHDPKNVMKQMLNLLELQGTDDFQEYFDIFRVSGDSGRSGTTIEPRARKPLSESFLKEIEASPYYQVFKSSVFNKMVQQ